MLNNIRNGIRFFSIFTKIKESKLPILHSCNYNINLNLATEEFIFEKLSLSNPALYFYRSKSCVVIGKHQNPWKECHIQEMQKNQICLSRRKTGGGAVYQDLGNTCFSFLIPIEKDSKLDFTKANQDIIANTMAKLNVKATFSGRNDILVDNKKISGSAYKLHPGKSILHHGTMLINLNKEEATKYLNPHKSKLLSKGISSVKARIANLQEFNSEINHEHFCEKMMQAFEEKYKQKSDHFEITYEDCMKEEYIKKEFEKSESWEWKYGESPMFSNNFIIRFDWGIIDMNIEVKEGIIIDGILYSDCLYSSFIEKINELIKSKKYHYSHEGFTKLGEDLKNFFYHDKIILGFIEAMVEGIIDQL